MRPPEDASGAFARFDAGWALFLLEADGRFAPNAMGNRREKLSEVKGPASSPKPLRRTHLDLPSYFQILVGVVEASGVQAEA
jgi:hypothetical protein